MGKLYLRIYNVQLLDPLPIVDLVIYQVHPPPPITGSAVSHITEKDYHTGLLY
jgi:hypothetical protein